MPAISTKEASVWGLLLLAALFANLSYGFVYSLSGGVWFDEALTTYFISLDWNELFRFISRYEANMALYYGVLKVWSYVTMSETWLRLFSLLAWCAAIWLLFLSVRKQFGVRPALAFLVLSLTHFFLIRYSVEIRGYALALFFTALLWFSWVKAVIEKVPSYWWLYALAGVFGVHAHFFVALGVFALGMIALFSIKGQARQWWAAHIVIGCSFLPIVAFVIFKESGQLAWIETPDIKSLIYLFFEFSGGAAQASDLIRYPLALAGLAGLGLAIVMCRPATGEPLIGSPRSLFILGGLGITGVPVILVFVLSQVEPVFAGRFFVPFVPFLLMVVAIGITWLFRRWTVAPITILAILLLLSTHSYSEREPNRWAAAYDYLSSRCEPGDGALFMGPRAQAAVTFYEQQADRRCEFQVLPYELTPETYFRTHDQYPRELSGVAPLTRVWIITTHVTPAESEILEAYRKRIEDTVGQCQSGYENEAIRIDVCG